MRTCGVAVVEHLAARGVRVVFGIPGVHTLELYRGLEQTGIRHVTARHEQGAGFMADGYARVSGQPGVAFVISGPGVTNILTPLGQARHDSSPLLVVSGAVDRAHAGRRRGVIHDLPDQAAVTATVTRRTLSLLDPAALDEVVEEAWQVLQGTLGPPGPVHLQIPIDVSRLPFGGAAPLGAREPTRLMPDAVSLDRATELLTAARAPAIVLGGGARDAGIPAARLAEKLGAPLGLTINAKGAVPPSHPLVVPSRMGFAPVDQLFLDADVVLAVGTQLSDLDWWMLERPFGFSGTVIRVDLDDEAFDVPVPCSVAVQGDAYEVLDALAAGVAASGRDAEAASRVREALAAIVWPHDLAVHMPLVRAIDEALPSDRIVAVDSTQPGYAANHALDVGHPRSWLMPIGYGTLGCALPMAIGASVAAPDRPVLALAGDGGVLFTIQELATACDLGLPLPIVVWNNKGYGEIRDAMALDHISPIGTDATATDFVRIAEGFGCHGVRPSSLDEVSEAITGALRADRPTVIEVTPEAVTHG